MTALEALNKHKNADPTTVDRISQVHPMLRSEVYLIYLEICDLVASEYLRIRFSDILRTFKKQDELYEQGRSTSGTIVTWVKGGGSYHNFGLAIDIVILLDKDKNGTFETASWDTTLDQDKDNNPEWLECVEIFEYYGWKWGLINSKGKRYDLPHFQKSMGFSTKELRGKSKDNDGYPIIIT
jgi:peptidoglycan L-alanyl-D-glutamate endopeptidase CwlK